ncbi:MAG TPA: hypothetical protein DCZ01_12125 [Elusimicrobia bacterium]|nr:MAG: hypothetical protein A2X37_01135 [Elusimicrobia bacterium GWA2_66_18]OGR70456.1 MAG: hypothetical protein A2X40_09205 [Elusimicrobia bacterium GWC2_65_9]HAZ09237.1 hypothetical protein [Elusimicrobiota bacterium]
MNIALMPRELKDINSLLALVMLAGVIAAACTVVYLLCRHHYACHKAKKSSKHGDHGHHDNHGRHPHQPKR